MALQRLSRPHARRKYPAGQKNGAMYRAVFFGQAVLVGGGSYGYVRYRIASVLASLRRQQVGWFDSFEQPRRETLLSSP